MNSLKLHQLAIVCLTAINSLRTAELIFIKFDSGELHTNFLTYCKKKTRMFLCTTFEIFISVKVFQCIFSVNPTVFNQLEGRKFCNVLNRTCL